MTTIDPGNREAPQSHRDAPSAPTRVARASLLLALIALAGGAGCIPGGQVPPMSS